MVSKNYLIISSASISRFSPALNFYHHRGNLSIYANLRLLFVNRSLSVSCSIIWKGVKSFLEFVCDALDFISIILHGGVIWVYWDFAIDLLCKNCQRLQNQNKMEIILQEDADIHRKQHQVHLSVHVSVVPVQDAGLVLTSFEGNLVYIYRFQECA